MSKLVKKIRDKKPVSDNQKISNYFKNLNGKKNETPKTGTTQSLEASNKDIIAATPEYKRSKSKSQFSLKCKRKSVTLDTSDIFDDITDLKGTLKTAQDTKKNEPTITNVASTSCGKYTHEIANMIVRSPPRKKASNSHITMKVVNLSKSEFEQMQLKTAEQKLARTSKVNICKEKTPIKVDNKQIFNSTLIPKEVSFTVANNQITPQKQTANTSEFGKSKYFTSGKKKTPQKLFTKSPNANEFRVEILQDFIIISPSQSNNRIPIINTTPKKSNEKNQKSILNYISPKPAESILESQSRNEHTPVKETIERNIINSASKCKVRLNFSNDIPISSSIVDDKNISKKNKIEAYTFDDSWDDSEMEKIPINLNLNLTDSCHCKVLEIDKSSDKCSVTILVQSTKSDEKSYCVLKDIWAYTPLAVGNIVRLTATKSHDCWEVTQKNGLIVLEPDVLISTTTITASMFCKRKTALKEKFYGFDPNSKFMIVGTLIHSLLQKSLRQKANSKEKVEKLMNDLLKSKDTFITLYFASINLDAIEKEMREFIPRIVSFIEQYICKKNVKKEKVLPENWKGSIDSIYDIEENIWCPELGLKGKVDITAKIGLAMMPVEVKTGRATFSLEHQAQILYYIMMMQKLGYNVPSGFLLYLREGKFKEILMNNRDYSHLINIRNELAYFLTRSTKFTTENNDLTVTTIEMPAPLTNRTNICPKCEYNVICSAYLRAENKWDTYPSFKPIQEEVLNHLEQKHLDYFIKWNNLIELENNSKISKKLMSEIFTVPAKEREKKGGCITNVYITNCVEDRGETFIQTFKKKYKEAVVNFFSSGIVEHSYVVVSSDKRPAIACGLVSSIDFESITIALDRNLLALHRSKGVYHLDTYDSHSSAMFLQSSLSIILDATPAARRLRDIVVDRTPTTQGSPLHRDVLKHGRLILAHLDRSQKMAILKALQTREYILIKGMPGTGKTATIVALVQMLVAMNQTVLITSHTNLAVDNVCMRLLDCNVAVLRLGVHSKTHERLQSRSEFTLTERCKNIDELDELYSKAQVVAVTCMGSKHPLLTKRTFDVCIVDESTQIIQCSLFRPITASKKFILVGDPDQLNPVVHSKEAIKLGFNESLFKYLDNNESTVLLDLNYRMNKTITDLANKLTYRDLLKIGNDTIANATLQIPNIETFHSLYASKRWILSALDGRLAKAVAVIDTGPIWNKPKITWNAGDELTEKSNCLINDKVKTCNQNPYEASIIVTLSNALLQGGVLAKNIGVIAPYQDQVTQLAQFLNPLQIDVSTVDKFQGQDKEIIFFSGTKSYDKKDGTFITEHHILEDNKRLTVAVTRSKHKLIIVGDVQTLNFYNPFQKLFAALSKQNVIQLEQNELDFIWESVVTLDDIKL